MLRSPLRPPGRGRSRARTQNEWLPDEVSIALRHMEDRSKQTVQLNLWSSDYRYHRGIIDRWENLKRRYPSPRRRGSSSAKRKRVDVQRRTTLASSSSSSLSHSVDNNNTFLVLPREKSREDKDQMTLENTQKRLRIVEDNLKALLQPPTPTPAKSKAVMTEDKKDGKGEAEAAADEGIQVDAAAVAVVQEIEKSVNVLGRCGDPIAIASANELTVAEDEDKDEECGRAVQKKFILRHLRRLQKEDKARERMVQQEFIRRLQQEERMRNQLRERSLCRQLLQPPNHWCWLPLFEQWPLSTEARIEYRHLRRRFITRRYTTGGVTEEYSPISFQSSVASSSSSPSSSPSLAKEAAKEEEIKKQKELAEKYQMGLKFETETKARGFIYVIDLTSFVVHSLRPIGFRIPPGYRVLKVGCTAHANLFERFASLAWSWSRLNEYRREEKEEEEEEEEEEEPSGTKFTMDDDLAAAINRDATTRDNLLPCYPWPTNPAPHDHYMQVTAMLLKTCTHLRTNPASFPALLCIVDTPNYHGHERSCNHFTITLFTLAMFHYWMCVSLFLCLFVVRDGLKRCVSLPDGVSHLDIQDAVDTWIEAICPNPNPLSMMGRTETFFCPESVATGIRAYFTSSSSSWLPSFGDLLARFTTPAAIPHLHVVPTDSPYRVEYDGPGRSRTEPFDFLLPELTKRRRPHARLPPRTS